MAPKSKKSTVLLFVVFLGIFVHKTCEAAKSCVSCVTMDNIVASAAVKEILQTSNHDLCRTIENANNRSGIKIDICESSSKIYEMKTCGILEGFVNGTAFKHPLNLKLFYRGCIIVKSMPRNSCQLADNNQMDLKQNLAQVFNRLQKYDLHSFHGQRCICDTDLCDISSSPCSRSLSLQLLILATFLSVLSLFTK